MNNTENGEFTQVNPNLNSRTGGLTYSVAAICILVFSLTLGSILNYAVPKYTHGYWYFNFLISPLALITCALIVIKLKKLPFKSVCPVKCKPKYYFMGLLVIIGLFCALNKVNDEVLKLIGVPTSEHMKKLEEFISECRGAEVIAAIIVIAIIPAVAEELVFRGIILNATENGAGSIKTVFITGFCFSLFHASAEQTVYQFIAGCLFAFVAIRSRSILPSTIMHFLNNAAVIILGVCGLTQMSQTADIVLICVGAACLVGGLVWLILDKTALKKCEKGGVKNFFMHASLGIAALAILWVCNLLLGG